jgi:hypothetical protein
LRIGLSLQMRLGARVDLFDFFFDLAKSHFRTPSQLIFLRAPPGLFLEIISFLVSAPACLLLLDLTQTSELRFV